MATQDNLVFSAYQCVFIAYEAIENVKAWESAVIR